MKRQLIQPRNKMILIVSLSSLVTSYFIYGQTTQMFASCGAWASAANITCVAVECWGQGAKELTTSTSLTNSVYKDGNASGASSGWTGLLSTDWNTGGNWYSGSVPTATDDVTIDVAASGNYPVISNANATANSVTIVAGASLTMQNGYNLTISPGGSFINNGSFNAAASTGAVVFAGAGNISGATNFKNVTINGSVDFGTASTITGNLLLNTGGTASGASTHLVNYTISSLLTYNTTVTTGNEWYQGGPGTIIPGAGIPQSVSIQNGIVTIPNAGGSNRAVAGNLNINTGGVLQFATGTTRDLFIAGNWDNTGAFMANGRRVTFDASSGTQTLSGNTTFYDLTLNNSGATTDFGISFITIDHEFRCVNGTMNGNISTFIFTGIPSGGYMEGPRSKNFYNLQINPGASISDLTVSAGDIHIANSLVNNGTFNQHASHTVYFDKTNATETFSGTGTTSFGKLVIGDNGFSFPTILNCTADFAVTGGSIIFYKNSTCNGSNNTTTFSANAATVSGSGAANFWNATTNVTLNLGNSPTNSVINNNLTLNPNGSVITNAPVYGGGATLIYNTATPALNTSIEWKNNTSSTGGAGAPVNVIIQSANDIVMNTPDGNKLVPGTLNIVNAANTLSINNLTLTVNGAITGAGSLTGSQTSGLVLGGTAAALLFTPGIYNNYLKTFTIKSGGSATLANALNIAAGSYASSGVLTADGPLDAAGFLTLKSDINGDARVGISSGRITGNVTAERFITGRRAWRFLTVPFASANQTINQAWQEGQVNTDLSCTYVDPTQPGLGTQLTYVNGYPGFDYHNTGDPSIKYWGGTAWVPISSTLAPHKLTDYQAWCVFIRGDRHICLNGINGYNNTVIRATGVLNQAGGTNQVIPSAPSGVNNYYMVGNPYASPVNLQDIISSRVSGFLADQIWVMDPRATGTYNVGGYVAYTTGVGWVPFDDSRINYSYAHDDPPVIQSGQGFMVYATSAAPQIEFLEADKDATQWNVYGATAITMQPAHYPVIYANLMQPDSVITLDGVAAAFNAKFSTSVDEKDVQKFWNTGENMAIIREEKGLAVEMRPFVRGADTIFYRLYLRQQPYVLKIFSANFTHQQLPDEAWLVDKYLNVQTRIDITQETLYGFTPNTDTNSYRNRFMLVFNHAKPGRPNLIDTLISKIKARIYPNPVSGKTFRLILGNATGGNYTLAIYNTAGRLIATRNINYTYGQNTYSVTVPPGITSGTYIVQVMNDNGIAVVSIPLVISR